MPQKIEQARKLEHKLRREWSWKYSNRVEVHVASASEESTDRLGRRCYQDSQLGRLINLRDEHVTIIYVMREHEDKLENLHFLQILETAFKDSELARLHIVVPKTCRFFIPGACTSRILHSCQKAINKIKVIVGDRPAVLVPGVLGDFV
jgi:hypothetical protein